MFLDGINLSERSDEFIGWVRGHFCEKEYRREREHRQDVDENVNKSGRKTVTVSDVVDIVEVSDLV